MTPNAFSAPAAERAVVGSVLAGEAALPDLSLTADDFTDPVCRELFGTMESLSARGLPTDLVTVTDHCATDAQTAVDIMTDCSAVSTVYIPRHTEEIREASLRRAVALAGRDLSRTAGDPGAEIASSLTAAQERLDGFFRGLPGKESVTMTEMALDWYRAMEGEADAAIPTGIPAIDACLPGGVRGSRLVVIGARPGVGKSAFGLQIGLNAAEMGKRVLLVSLEMGGQEIFGRVLSRYSGLAADRFERRDLTPEEWVTAARAQGEASVLPIRVSTEAATPGQIRALAAKLRHGEGLDLIIVDYLQLLSADGRCFGRTEEVGSISRALKRIAQDYGIPVVAMTQFNRESERDREAARLPRMSESRESGSIEQDADTFLILHQPAEEQIRTAAGRSFFRLCRERDLVYTEIVVAKNRGGRKTVKTHAAFDGTRMRFTPAPE